MGSTDGATYEGYTYEELEKEPH
uniref:Uncharacterized protein n=1 Tax=Vitis vinifera TaxID=29760 RepID=F6I4Z7_VITVI